MEKVSRYFRPLFNAFYVQEPPEEKAKKSLKILALFPLAMSSIYLTGAFRSAGLFAIGVKFHQEMEELVKKIDLIWNESMAFKLALSSLAFLFWPEIMILSFGVCLMKDGIPLQGRIGNAISSFTMQK